MNKIPTFSLQRIVPMILYYFPYLVESKWNDPGSVSLDALKLRRRCDIGNYHRARDPDLLSPPSKSLRHIARAYGVNSLGQRFSLRQNQSVAHATHLERARWLKVLKLEKDTCRRVVHVQMH